MYIVVLKNGEKYKISDHRNMIEFCVLNDVVSVDGGYYN